MPARYCFYRLTSDTGFAPNPFHGCCTLAVCTPNHKRAAHIGPGTVIVGVEADSLVVQHPENPPPSTSKRHLVFWMKVAEQRSLTDYFKDTKFYRKIPNPNGNYRQQCGDNCYSKDASGDWHEVDGHWHSGDPDIIAKDKRGDRVWIATDYYYFGNRFVAFPSRYESYLPPKQGIKYSNEFLDELDMYVRSEARNIGARHRLGMPINYDSYQKC